jgi:preprotein translocase subunit YajC
MDPTFIVLILGLGVFIVFQVFQGRKRRAETLDRQTKFVPGVEIMTNYGLYGTIVTMDDATNVVTIESTPGTVLKIHRQTILKVADYAVVADDADEADDVAAVTTHDVATEDPDAPAFGERLPGDQTGAQTSREQIPGERLLDAHGDDGSSTGGPTDGRRSGPSRPLDDA